MTSYSWTVVINKLPFGTKAAHPWTAVSRALQVYCKEHPQSSRILFDIYVVNRTLADQGRAVEETFNRHRKELMAEADREVGQALSCKRVRDAYLTFRTLTDPQKNLVNEHLKSCKSCQEWLKQQEKVGDKNGKERS